MNNRIEFLLSLLNTDHFFIYLQLKQKHIQTYVTKSKLYKFLAFLKLYMT